MSELSRFEEQHIRGINFKADADVAYNNLVDRALTLLTRLEKEE